MKTLVAILLALGVGFAAAYVVVSKQKGAQPAKSAAAPAPEAAGAAAPVEKVIRLSAPSAPAGESAQDILNDLLGVKLGGGNARNAGLRLVVYKMECLTQQGTMSVPAIRSFIGRNVDVSYGEQENQNDNPPPADANGGNGGNNPGFNRGGGNGGGGGRGGARRARNLQNLQADWIVPPSLRLGLISTLREIGGAEGEQALVEMLGSTGRGVEVAYLTVILEDLAPGKYRDTAIKTAQELLMNPPPVDSPDRLDQLSKSYLYGVLEFYKDASFAVNAEQMLVGADGRLDADAMDYLSTVLKDQSVSALYAAYENPALTNQFDRMQLSRDILNYVGPNSQANALFTETLNNPDMNARQKAMQVAGLAGGGGGPFGGGTPADPGMISSRIRLLQQLQQNPAFANDPEISRMIAFTIGNLNGELNGQPPQDPRQAFDQGGQGGRGGQGQGGGGRRNRGGQGQGGQGGGFNGGGNNF